MSFALASLVALQELFTTHLALEEMRNKQAVVETSLGEMVIDLLEDKAPNHVGYFMKLAAEGAYDGTSFHRVVKYGIVQGGDPRTKNPGARGQYGTGGLALLARELSDEKHTRGAIAAVQIPGKPDSATVGVSGSIAERFGPVIAMALSLPPFTCPSSVGTDDIRRSTRPPSRSVMAGAAPL